MSRPLTVSVIVPCYNQAASILDTLRSVAAQQYPHWDCVVVDDGSSDDSAAVVEGWIKTDSRFRYVHKANGGVASARNLGISLTQGELILPLDGDDQIHPGYLAAAVSQFEVAPATALVYSHARRFGEQRSVWRLPPYRYEDLLWHNCLFNSSIYRRSLFERSSGYSPAMVHGYEDWELYVRMLDADAVVHRLDYPYYIYRVQAVSRSTEQLKCGRIDKSHQQIVANNTEKYAQALQDPIKTVTEYGRRCALDYAQRYKRQRRYLHLIYLMVIAVLVAALLR
ncbi:glycosyltransferase family 2 protein [Chitinimonas naiadis]